jgi:hypothetical protein
MRSSPATILSSVDFPRPDQDHEFAVGDIDGNAMQDIGRPKALGDVLDLYRTHSRWHSSRGGFFLQRLAITLPRARCRAQ